MHLTSTKKNRFIGVLSIGVIVAGALAYGCSDDETKTTPTTPGTDSGTGGETSTADSGNKDTGGGTDTGTTDTGTTTDSGTAAKGVANLAAVNDSGVTGTATFTANANDGGASVTISISGATDGLHGIHIHANSFCEVDDAGTVGGGHWNPANATHGYPDAATHHLGDMGNITIASGTGTLTLSSPDWKITPSSDTNSVLQHAVIFHAGTDDGVTQPTGDAGARIACGVIQQQ